MSLTPDERGRIYEEEKARIEAQEQIKAELQAKTTGPLDAEIEKYVSWGFRLISRTETTAQLVKPKTFSYGWAVFWLIFGFGIGIVLYIFYYLGKKDETVYLQVNHSGRLSVNGEMRPLASTGSSSLGEPSLATQAGRAWRLLTEGK